MTKPPEPQAPADLPTLLIIDVQVGFDDETWWGERNNPTAEKNVAKILAEWRAREGSMIHVQHASESEASPLNASNPGFAFKPEAKPLPGETVVRKAKNSAFIGTRLETLLAERGSRDLIVVGLTTDHCVSTTVRMAGNLGFSVTLVEDATATFERTDHRGVHYTAESLHATHIASLQDEFCRVVTTDELTELLGAGALRT